MVNEYNVWGSSHLNSSAAYIDGVLSHKNVNRPLYSYSHKESEVAKSLTVSATKNTDWLSVFSRIENEPKEVSLFKISTLKNDSYDKNIDFIPHPKLDKAYSFTSPGSTISTFVEDSAEDFYDELLVALYSDDSQLGEPSKVKDLIVELYKDNRQAFFSAYQKLWLDLYERGNDDALYSLIMKSASLPNEYFSYYAKVMVCACASHKSVIIQEAAIKAVDMWGDSKFIDVLKGMREFDIAWLEQYRCSVIDSLERVR
ncbi:hypothetical protein SJS46_05330 [Aeromonas caviae]|uniref:hypothetical protein n=1 Tax=Aeromonas caviae TaxID=648 RepID=UPI0029DCC8B8|nr:hypothetical protein [Aeromonas caviae]MDX7732592.1 hypothetical protein [Aeromonas caviae]